MWNSWADIATITPLPTVLPQSLSVEKGYYLLQTEDSFYRSQEKEREEKRVREKERQELKQQLDDRNKLTAFPCLKEKKKNGRHWSICFFLSFCFFLLSHHCAGRHIIFSFIRSLHHLPPDLFLHLYGV